ncbi:nucleoporin NDC1 isoform X2 [Dermochelys coriacea]|uniref:nucleoporin NDC1 isoform X2 n=1 Tax=Dermochelys coriacea TaxID=27794 RepID=UPI001CA89A18|nr:nucleoporin NDC1 isoform X2 [Dermochelys coriacea]
MRAGGGEQQALLRQVLGWRVAASIAWSILLLPLCTAVFISISSIDLFHPVQWISNSFNDWYTSYVIFCILLMSVVILIISIFNVEFYAVVPSIPCSRLALLGKIIHPRQVIHSVVHAIMGMLMAWCAAVMTKGKFQFLALPCTASESLDGAVQHMCLNEYHLFLLLSGAFMGYSYSLLYLVNNMNYLPFPIIQQYKYLRFRRSLPLLVKRSCVESLYLVRNICVAYYFFGYIPRAWISTTMDLHTDSKLHPLDTLTGLLDLSLLYHTWLCGIFLLITWHIAWLLFKIYATEAHHFPVQPTFAEETDQCLPKILNSNPPLIIKFLALQDLMLLSQYSPVRRQEVFSLSQPGGHPHNWTAISKECLNLLSDLTQKLIMQQEAAAANGRVKQPSTGEVGRSLRSPGIFVWEKIHNSCCAAVTEEMAFQTQRSNVISRAHMPSLVKSSLLPLKALSTSDLGSSFGSPFSSPALNHKAGILDLNSPWHGSVQSPHVMRRGPKLWTSSSDLQMNGSHQASFPVISVARAGNEAIQPSFIYTWLQNKQEQVRSFLSKRVLIMYFFSKHPEALIQAVFSDAQMHIWALEGLSRLVAASFTEDRFGVVQTTLPAILNTLLTLQEVVDKHFKLPHASSKPPRISGSLMDTSYKTLRFALRASLKTSIYRVTTTFGEHLNAVQVSAEHKKRLQQFLEFKE